MMMERRRFIALGGTVLTALAAGCAGEDTGNGDGTENEDGDDSSGGDSSSDGGGNGSESGGDDSGGNDGGNGGSSSEDENSGDSSGNGGGSGYSVHVQYSGEWSGSIAAGGSSRSVDGSGDQTFDVEGSPTTISANAQKQDDSGDTLVIQILEGDEVLKEQSTSAEYGVAQTTYSDF